MALCQTWQHLHPQLCLVHLEVQPWLLSYPQPGLKVGVLTGQDPDPPPSLPEALQLRLGGQFGVPKACASLSSFALDSLRPLFEGNQQQELLVPLLTNLQAA